MENAGLYQSLLANLSINKVSLVDAGADDEAHIRLFKSKEGGVQTMTYEEIIKSLKPEMAQAIEAEVTKAKQEASDEKAKCMKLAEEKTTLEDDVEKLRNEVETLKKSNDPGLTEEDVLKSLDPAAREIIAKSIQQARVAEEAVKKMREEQLEVEAVAKAAEITSLGVEAPQVVSLYKGLSTEQRTTVFGMLKHANDLVAKSAAFGEAGSAATATVGDADSAWAAIEKAAKELVGTDGITATTAVAEVIKRKPELYTQYLDAQNAQ